MDTETPSPRRRPSPWLLALLGVAIVALVAHWMWPEPAATPAAPRTRAANRAGGAGTADPAELDVRLEGLNAKRPEPGNVERNPFRFKPPPAPPPPKLAPPP